MMGKPGIVSKSKVRYVLPPPVGPRKRLPFGSQFLSSSGSQGKGLGTPRPFNVDLDMPIYYDIYGNAFNDGDPAD